MTIKQELKQKKQAEMDKYSTWRLLWTLWLRLDVYFICIGFGLLLGYKI